MIKKFVLILFALIVLVTFVACDAFAYREGPIKLTNTDTSEYVGELSDEQKEYLLSVWRESEWFDGMTKSHFDFEFEYDGLKIKYCRDHGSFYDERILRRYVVRGRNNLLGRFRFGMA